MKNTIKKNLGMLFTPQVALNCSLLHKALSLVCNGYENLLMVSGLNCICDLVCGANCIPRKTNTLKTLAISLSILSAQALLAKSENRLETTSQVTGCRLQGTGAEMAELPLKDQIRQRTKPTTNYELRTTNYELQTANCDNQGDNLDCHLMMDPVTSSMAEEGIEAISSLRAKPSVLKKERGSASATAQGGFTIAVSSTSNDIQYAAHINTQENTTGRIQEYVDSSTPAAQEAKEFEDYISKEIADVKDQAEQTDQEAEDALSVAKEQVEQAENFTKVWENVIETATYAIMNYNTLATCYSTYQNCISGYYQGSVLKKKMMKYDADQKIVERRKEYWENVIEDAKKCLQGGPKQSNLYEISSNSIPISRF